MSSAPSSSSQYQYTSRSVEQLAKQLSLQRNPRADPRDFTHGSTLQVEWKGMNVPLLSGLTRTMLAHVESMRFQWYVVNDFVTNDRVQMLGLTLGQLPIKVNPSLFEWDNEDNPPPSWEARYPSYSVRMDDAGHGVLARPGQPQHGTHYDESPPSPPNPRSTLRFDLDVECTYDPVTRQVSHQYVCGEDLKWVPLPGQIELLCGQVPEIPAKAEICRLNVGQRLAISVYAVKGKEEEHAKFGYVRVGQKMLSEDDGHYEQSIMINDGIVDPRFPLHRAVQVLREKFQQLYIDCLVHPTCPTR